MRIEIPEDFVEALAERLAEKVMESLQSAEQRPMTKMEVAEFLGVSSRTVTEMVANGRLPRVGGTARVLVPRWAVMEMANGGRAAG